MFQRTYVKRYRTRASALGATALVASLAAAPPWSGAAGTSPHATPSPAAMCPWIAQSLHHSKSASALADEVLSRMTLAQEAGYAVLATRSPVENANTAIPSLCLPSLTMTDGPDGVANGLTGVTQLPAELGVAATFDPAIARSLGRVLGSETRAKGFDAVQGPELNLARVALGGRIFETYGEDPYLSGVMGVDAIRGIQSAGVMANAKHFTAYTQETARARLNQVVTPRALAELYNAPFQAAVQQGHVASIMCSYGWLNGVTTCQNPYIYKTLASWGFKGFVRSDLGAVKDLAQAYQAGISLVKPASPDGIVALVRRGALARRDLDRAVHAVLTEMFAHSLITRPPAGSLLADVASAAHASVALDTARASVVLLKNSGSVLPLAAKVPSVAVIGPAGASNPSVTGGGSSKVKAPYVITPLAALRSTLGPAVRVTYQAGGPSSLDIDTLSDVDITKGTPLKLEKPLRPVGEPGKADLAIENDPSVTPAVATAAQPGKGEGWSSWHMQVRAKKTGTYEISFQQFGDTWVYLNGHPILASPGLHAPAYMATSVNLVAHQRYTLSARWFNIRNHPAPMLGLVDVTSQINAAVAAAKRARVAIVFAGDYNSEGVDRGSLDLPGNQNALISAVAAVNPRTVVVLDTGGAVAMPWLSHVAAVLEAWYPGQEDGAAITAVLTGAVDPSGRLPITFPDPGAVAASSYSQFPGVNATVTFGTGLNVGYRWYQSMHVQPLFPFGFGLDYTTFSLSQPVLSRSATGVRIQLTVTNSGRRAGTDVVEAYAHFPAATGEPPEQLRGFTRVTLAPSASRRVALTLPYTGFRVYLHGAMTKVPGAYRIDVGSSSEDLPIHLNLTLS